MDFMTEINKHFENALDAEWQRKNDELRERRFNEKKATLQELNLDELNERFSAEDQKVNKQLLIDVIAENPDDFDFETLSDCIANSSNPKHYTEQKKTLIEELLR